jgi:hypothetical protein
MRARQCGLGEHDRRLERRPQRNVAVGSKHTAGLQVRAGLQVQQGEQRLRCPYQEATIREVPFALRDLVLTQLSTSDPKVAEVI